MVRYVLGERLVKGAVGRREGEGPVLCPVGAYKERARRRKTRRGPEGREPAVSWRRTGRDGGQEDEEVTIPQPH